MVWRNCFREQFDRLEIARLGLSGQAATAEDHTEVVQRDGQIFVSWAEGSASKHEGALE